MDRATFLALLDPDDFRPFPSRRNQHADQVAERIVPWAREAGLLQPGQNELPGRTELYGGWVYPTADADGALLASQWMVLFMEWDNHLDDRPLQDIPAESWQLLNELHRLVTLDDPQPPAGLLQRSAYARAFHRLWQRSRQLWRQQEGWQRRFVDGLRLYQQHQQWELFMRDNKRSLDVFTHIESRRHSALANTAATFNELFLPRPPCDQVMDHQLVGTMAAIAGDLGTMAADAFSLTSETGQDAPNILLILRDSLHRPLPEAVHTLALLWKARARLLAEMADDLPALLPDQGFTPAQIAMARDWAEALLTWVGGNLAWGQITTRYTLS